MAINLLSRKVLWIPGLGALAVIVVGAVALLFIKIPERTPAEQARTLVEVARPSEQDLSQAIALDPTFTTAWVKRAELRLAAGRMDEALEDANAAIKLVPELQSALQLRAKISAARGGATTR